MLTCPLPGTPTLAPSSSTLTCLPSAERIALACLLHRTAGSTRGGPARHGAYVRDRCDRLAVFTRRRGCILDRCEENHSFDNLYGLFPGANGVANATAAQMAQVDKQGAPFATLPAPLAAPVSGTRDPDPRFPAGMANGPFLLNQYVSPDDKTGDMI